MGRDTATSKGLSADVQRLSRTFSASALASAKALDTEEEVERKKKETASGNLGIEVVARRTRIMSRKTLYPLYPSSYHYPSSTILAKRGPR